MSFDDVKTQGISIDGGSIGKTDLATSVRNADDVTLKGKGNNKKNASTNSNSIADDIIKEYNINNTTLANNMKPLIETLENLGLGKDSIKEFLDIFKNGTNNFGNDAADKIYNANNAIINAKKAFVDPVPKNEEKLFKEILKLINKDNYNILSKLSSEDNANSLKYLIAKEIEPEDALNLMNELNELNQLSELATLINKNNTQNLDTALEKYLKAKEDYEVYADFLSDPKYSNSVIDDYENARVELNTEELNVIYSCIQFDISKITNHINADQNILKQKCLDLIRADISEKVINDYLYIDTNTNIIYSAMDLFDLEPGAKLNSYQKELINRLGGMQTISSKIDKISIRIEQKIAGRNRIWYTVEWKNGTPDWNYMSEQFKITGSKSSGTPPITAKHKFNLTELTDELNKTYTKEGVNESVYKNLIEHIQNNTMGIDTNTGLLNLLNNQNLWDYTGLVAISQKHMFINLHDRLRFIERVIIPLILKNEIDIKNINSEIENLTNALYESINNAICNKKGFTFEVYQETNENIVNTKVSVQTQKGTDIKYIIGLDASKQLKTIIDTR